MLRRGELEKVIWMRGTPTIMIGAVDDPNFEQHLEEGPYVVFDNAAKPEYKNDPRVYFVPSHPVLQTAMPELMKGLGVSWPGQAVMKWEQFERRGMRDSATESPDDRKTLSYRGPGCRWISSADTAGDKRDSSI
jgi:hypothetical protein